jgi:indolepyruvate ferredoxin oxidoreductase alpha subunit
MAYEGFELSEKFNLPVLMRITTRLSHSRAGIKRKSQKVQNHIKLPKDPRQFVLLPAIARKRYKHLLEAQNELEKSAYDSKYNKLIASGDKSLGIIACGISLNYLEECFPDGVPWPVLKISQYPAPKKMLEGMLESCDSLLVLEEGYPMLEEGLRGYLNNSPVPIHGRLDGSLPRDGELNPDIVGRALGMIQDEGPDIPDIMINRPPSLCKGCGHIDTFKALLEALEPYGDGRTFSDIGCYTLGALPPFDAVNTCVDMGASVTMAKGAADAGLVPSVAVIGDSTFTHSGMTGLLDAVIEHSPITVIISDNETTGMTGGQKSSALGRLESICKGIGVDDDHLRIITPLKKNHDVNVNVMKEELEYKGTSVIISRRECIQTVSRRKRK